MSQTATTEAWDTMMEAFNAFTRNTDPSESERLRAQYLECSRRVTDPSYNGCDHEYVEYDERQVACDRFVSELTGTCEDCGMTVEWVEDWDEDGRDWYRTERVEA